MAAAPVIASTYPDWIADFMLASALYPTFTLANLLSHLFPQHVQAYYDAARGQGARDAASWQGPKMSGRRPLLG